jgi:flagellar assembly protein FliH
MHATPWSLDEFAAHDLFVSPPPAMVADEHVAPPAISLTELEATFELRLAAEREQIEAEAYARGHADGERAAQAALDPRVDSAMQMLGEAAQSVQLHSSRWISNAEENIAALAVLVARHIVQRKIAIDPSFVQSLVEQALTQYPVDEELTIRVNPEELETCRAYITHSEATRQLRWVADHEVMRGGCLLEGRERVIDGRVDTAIERTYRTLAGVPA